MLPSSMELLGLTPNTALPYAAVRGTEHRLSLWAGGGLFGIFVPFFF